MEGGKRGRGVLKIALNFEYRAKNPLSHPPLTETLVEKANFLKKRKRKEKKPEKNVRSLSEFVAVEGRGTAGRGEGSLEQ